MIIAAIIGVTSTAFVLYVFTLCKASARVLGPDSTEITDDMDMEDFDESR